MAGGNERLAVLEEKVRTLSEREQQKNATTSRKIMYILLTACLPGFGWWVWWTSSSLIAIKQQLADGGNKQLVTELKSPQSLQQLQANLSTIVAQVQTARVEHKSPDVKKTASLASGLADVLVSHPALPSAWQAASELVSYRSDLSRKKYIGQKAIVTDWPDEIAESNADVPANQPLPSCSTRHLMREITGPLTPLTRAGAAPGQTTTQVSQPELRNCSLDLDAVGISEFPSWLGTPVIVCLGCDVHYSGGQIPLLKSGTQTLQLVDCRFNLSVAPTSPQTSKRLVENLLAENDPQSGVLVSSPS